MLFYELIEYINMISHITSLDSSLKFVNKILNLIISYSVYRFAVAKVIKFYAIKFTCKLAIYSDANLQYNSDTNSEKFTHKFSVNLQYNLQYNIYSDTNFKSI